MAAPIEFQPKKVDPRLELQRRLEAAPMEHAESILAALDVLEAAHRKGLVGLAEGAISSKDAVFAKLAEYAKQPESTNALRNLLVLGKVFGSVDPARLRRVTEARSDVDRKPPSLWRLFRRLRDEDVRRGLSMATELLAVIGSPAAPDTHSRNLQSSQK
jgi:uncharacterized protein YjgD (DUF1641 family)